MSQRLAAQFTRPAVRVLLLLLVVALTATGCGRNNKDKAAESRPVEAIYAEAHADMTHGNWSGAEKQFQALIAQYPYGPYTEQAQMEIAYAQYKSGKMDEAVSSIDRFLRTYPTQRNVPYMYYLRGLANASRDTVFLQKVWRLDSSRRDLSTPLQGYSDFNTVSERYPNSRYADDARRRMIELRNIFARHEMDTALYYLHRGAYVAAATRAKYILETIRKQVPVRCSGHPGRGLYPAGQPDPGQRCPPRAADERPAAPVAERRLARLSQGHPQAQPIRRGEVGAGQRGRAQELICADAIRAKGAARPLLRVCRRSCTLIRPDNGC